VIEKTVAIFVKKPLQSCTLFTGKLSSWILIQTRDSAEPATLLQA